MIEEDVGFLIPLSNANKEFLKINEKQYSKCSPQ
mgnify:CR=1 FL=1